jgi:hypothetical protein
MTTTIQSSIKYDRDSRDFAVIVDDQIVGYRATHAEAEALLNETVTRITALRAQADTPACRTCGGRIEVDNSAGLFDDECDACAALCCEACGESVGFEDSFILGDLVTCAACYAAQQAHVAAMAALAAADDDRRAAHGASLVAEYEAQIDEIVAADQRRAYRESLAEAGSAADEAQRLAQFLRQAEDAAHEVGDNDPPRTEAAEDRYNRGGW